MSRVKEVNRSSIRLIQQDITDLEIDAFVYYATPDLRLGAGFGNAISMRGGPTIQKELDEIGPLEVTEVAVSEAGNMKAGHILHAVGPKFQEPGMVVKLRKTIFNCLVRAEERGFERVALPPMGAGFYGLPLDDSARITVGTVMEHLENSSKLKEVVICANDGREYRAFEATLGS
jgi:O-acetyl-ADP-ribose deacetylase (regulator of RNase III)